jgi:hypothetical protein
MNYVPPIGIFAILFAGGFSLASAQETAPSPATTSIKPAAQTYVLPPGITEDMLAPPPVPRFMLEKPDKPLSNEEMLKQAREAESTIKPNIPQPVTK